jgi:mxaK protein
MKLRNLAATIAILSGLALVGTGLGQRWASHPDALVIQARTLLATGHIEAAQSIADRLPPTTDPAQRDSLLYALANANFRHALTIFTQVPFRQVKPIIMLAKTQYQQALTLDPGDWDAKYNFALAAALVRDTERAEPSMGSQMAHQRAAWPDIPGAPNGMP